MIKYKDFINESKYLIEDIKDKYYIFRKDKNLYLIEIQKIADNRIYFRVLLPLGKKTNFLIGKYRPYAPYYVTFSKWKRSKFMIVFSTNSKDEAKAFFNSKILKNLDVDPYDEEDWGFSD